MIKGLNSGLLQLWLPRGHPVHTAEVMWVADHLSLLDVSSTLLRVAFIKR